MPMTRGQPRVAGQATRSWRSLLLGGQHPVHLGATGGADALGRRPPVGQRDLLAVELALLLALHAVTLVVHHDDPHLSQPVVLVTPGVSKPSVCCPDRWTT